MPHSFQPIINKNCKVLILGSFPSIKSVENDFYYGNVRNHFWSIMNDIFRQQALTNEHRKQLVLDNGIALWDTVKHCERKNSSDSSLQVVAVNDIEELLSLYPKIHTIFFNGKRSFAEYKKHFGHLHIKTVQLPSTSPANAIISYQEKLKIYSTCIAQALELSTLPTKT